jgi:ABC-type uncharacterized transport system substrate-binding protein
MRRLAALVVLAVLAVPGRAGDFDAVIKSARQAWPERRTVVVVCHKDASSMALMDLGSATENLVSMFVLHVDSQKDLDKTLSTVTRKPKDEIFLLLISDDPVTGEATQAGKILVGRMTSRGIPVVGTTAAALKLGAVFAQGPGTGDKLVPNHEVAKKLGVALPVDPAPEAPAPAK